MPDSAVIPPPPELTYRTILDHLRENAERLGDREALYSIDQERGMSWAELYGITNRLAHFLAGKGIKANDRVLVLTDNSLENLILYYGVQRYGATFCTINVEINAAHVREMAERLQPKLVLWHEVLDGDAFGAGSPGEWIHFGDWQGAEKPGGLFAQLADCPETPELPPVNGPDDISLISFTSGTSAKPKGVMQSFANYYAIGCSTVYLWGLTDKDRVLEYRSFSWASAHEICIHPCLISGDTLLFARKFSISRYFDWIRDLKPTCSVGIPTVINMMLSKPLNADAPEWRRLRFISCSTAPLIPEQQRKFEEMYGLKVVQHYGMSEGGTIAGNHHAAPRLGSVGRPGIFQNLKIVDENGNALPTGEVGEIEVGGAQNSYGVLMEDGSVERVRPNRLKTGDLGYLDEEGFLYVTGRAKDLIIRGGVNIAPLEIDGVVMEHPAVQEVATIGVPDKVYGEGVVCYVALKPGQTPDKEKLLEHCKSKLSDFKLPQEILFTDTILKNERGKIDRNAMVALWKETHSEVAKS